MKPEIKVSPIVKTGLAIFSIFTLYTLISILFDIGDGPYLNYAYKLGIYWFIITILLVLLIGYLRRKFIYIQERRYRLVQIFRKIEKLYRIVIGTILVSTILAPVLFFIIMPFYLMGCIAITTLSFGQPYWLFLFISILPLIISVFTEDIEEKGLTRGWFILYIIIFTTILFFAQNTPMSATECHL